MTRASEINTLLTDYPILSFFFPLEDEGPSSADPAAVDKPPPPDEAVPLSDTRPARETEMFYSEATSA